MTTYEDFLHTPTDLHLAAAPPKGGQLYANGIMVALYPDPEIAKKVALEDGEDPDTLHVTLAYLGKRGEDGVQDSDDWPDLHNVARDVAKRHGPLDASVNGVAKFIPGDNGTPFVGIVGAHGLHELRTDLVNQLRGRDVQVSDKFPFQPHVTLKYLADKDEDDLLELDKPIDLGMFNKLVVKNGQHTTEYPLTGKSVQPSESIEKAAHDAGENEQEHLEEVGEHDHYAYDKSGNGWDPEDDDHFITLTGDVYESGRRLPIDTSSDCPKCHGVGYFVDDPRYKPNALCPHCTGHGHVPDSDEQLHKKLWDYQEKTGYLPNVWHDDGRDVEMCDHAQWDETEKKLKFVGQVRQGPAVPPEQLLEHLKQQHETSAEEVESSGLAPEKWHDGFHSDLHDGMQTHWHYPGTFKDFHKVAIDPRGTMGGISYSTASCSCGWQMGDIRSDPASYAAWKRHTVILDEQARKEKAGPPRTEMPPASQRWRSKESNFVKKHPDREWDDPRGQKFYTPDDALVCRTCGFWDEPTAWPTNKSGDPKCPECGTSRTMTGREFMREVSSHNGQTRREGDRYHLRMDHGQQEVYGLTDPEVAHMHDQLHPTSPVCDDGNHGFCIRPGCGCGCHLTKTSVLEDDRRSGSRCVNCNHPAEQHGDTSWSCENPVVCESQHSHARWCEGLGWREEDDPRGQFGPHGWGCGCTRYEAAKTAAKRVMNLDKLKQYVDDNHPDVSVSWEPDGDWVGEHEWGKDHMKDFQWMSQPQGYTHMWGGDDGPDPVHTSDYDGALLKPFNVTVKWNPNVHERDHATMVALHELGHVEQAKKDWAGIRSHNRYVHDVDDDYEREAFENGMGIARKAGIRVTPRMKEAWALSHGGEHLK